MTPSGIDPPQDAGQEQERHEQVERVRWIEVVDQRLDLVRPGQLVLGVVDAGVEPALGHELVVVEVRADRVLAVDDAEEDDRLERGERQRARSSGRPTAVAAGDCRLEAARGRVHQILSTQ